jgi:hypothetical protein
MVGQRIAFYCLLAQTSAAETRGYIVKHQSGGGGAEATKDFLESDYFAFAERVRQGGT